MFNIERKISEDNREEREEEGKSSRSSAITSGSESAGRIPLAAAVPRPGRTWSSERERSIKETRDQVEGGFEAALYNACCDGFVESIECSLSWPGTDVNRRSGKRRRTALFVAAQAGHLEAVEMLVGHNKGGYGGGGRSDW
jgi:hypothetical protein